jgi:hypothetical protein
MRSRRQDEEDKSIKSTSNKTRASSQLVTVTVTHQDSTHQHDSSHQHPITITSCRPTVILPPHLMNNLNICRLLKNMNGESPSGQPPLYGPHTRAISAYSGTVREGDIVCRLHLASKVETTNVQGAKYSRKLLQVPVTSQPAAKHAPGDCSQHTDSRRASSARPPAPAPIGRQGRDTHFGVQNLP